VVGSSPSRLFRELLGRSPHAAERRSVGRPTVEPEMSAYEVLDLVSGTSAVFDSIFSYWITVSFGVVAGAFIARDHINLGLALTMATVYAVGSVMFALRFYSNGQLLSHVFASPALPEEFLASVAVLGPLRVGTFVLGFVMTEFFVFYTYVKRGREA
jgi:hypothetical protein